MRGRLTCGRCMGRPSPALCLGPSTLDFWAGWCPTAADAIAAKDSAGAAKMMAAATKPICAAATALAGVSFDQDGDTFAKAAVKAVADEVRLRCMLWGGGCLASLAARKQSMYSMLSITLDGESAGQAVPSPVPSDPRSSPALPRACRLR